MIGGGGGGGGYHPGNHTVVASSLNQFYYRTGNICCRVTRNAGGCGVTRDQASATNFR